MQKANNILVTAPSWVGDVVMATPSFRCVRENFPDANITLLLKPYAKEILGGAPWFDRVIEYDTKDKHKQAGKYLSLIKKLRKTKYDLAFVLPNSFSSALITWSAGASRRIGYVRDNRAWLLTDAVQRPKENGRFLPTYMGDYYLRLCTSIGCKVGSKKTEIFVSPESGKKIEQLFSKHGLTSNSRLKVLINPGATYGSSKFWTADGFAETAKLLREQKDCDVLLVTSPDEKDVADKIVDASDGNIVNLSQDRITLELLKALVDKCSLLITVDSGPRHIAVALNKPVVTLIGPTDPRYSRTKQEIGKVVRAPVDCAPCHLKTCPTDHRCMAQIKPQKVVAAAIELLPKRKARARKQ
ncbi:MAG: lipopolysaccharide heptosyltransferase II [Candidatus Brocadiales bacterium]